MMKKFIKVTSLLVLLMLMLVSSCLVDFAKEKVITFANPEDFQFTDPCDSYNNVNIMTEYMVYDRLIDLNPETGAGFVPALATEWKISPDGKEYTFKLREGVKFHNGEPFNAECVKVTFERFINDHNLRRGYGYLWPSLKEVDVVDDYNIIIKFNNTNVMCLASLVYTPILPAKAFKEKGTALFDNPIGTGAFTWGYWKRGQEIVFNKNPNYWGKPAFMDKFVYLPITEISTRLAGSLTGEIDCSTNMTADQIPLAESSGNIKIIKKLAWDQVYIALKTDKQPFTDIKFRQAIGLAIDKEGIVKQVMKGGRVSTGVIPQGVFGFDDSLVPVKQDIEKAKQLVKESVYDGRIIDIMVPIGWFPNEKEVAQAIQGNLKEIGINCKLSILEGATFAERRAGADYDIFLNQWSHLGDINNFLVIAIAADAHKMGNINPELKRLALEQSSIVDKQKRTEMLRKIENIINTDFAPIIMVCQYEDIYFQQKGLQGVRYYGDKCPDFRYASYEEW
jgi:peptide/nickel transport system substrate-binding protein